MLNRRQNANPRKNTRKEMLGGGGDVGGGGELVAMGNSVMRLMKSSLMNL
jgi:hypothetical protein